MRIRGFTHALLGGLLVCTEWLLAAGTPAFGQPRSSDSNVGYIDNALIGTQVRLRYEAAYRDNVPDRAEFFYGKCGCFRVLGADPSAPGPPKLEKNVDYQDIRSYVEVALSERFSGFVEIPQRFLNPQVNDNASGLGDMDAGFKVALLSRDDQVLTFQLRTFAPTGEAHLGLGNNHVSLEPALLLWQRLSDRLVFEGEFRDWIPIGGTDFAGNIIRYGTGVSYEVYRSCCLRVLPVVEVVGWTVLSGKKLEVPPETPLNAQGFASTIIPAVDASGDTIVNLKLGLRLLFGNHSSFYAGYGRALTGDVWYKDIMRFEYRWVF